MGETPATRIGEGDVGEFDRRLQRSRRGTPRACGRVGHRRLGVEDAIDALCRRHPDHALMQHGTQVAHRAEHLDAGHQDHQQRGQFHRPRLDAEGAQRQCCRGTQCDGGVGNAARQRVGRQHPHGRAEQLARLHRQQIGARPALPESLQRGQALDRIQQLGGEAGIGALPVARLAGVQLVPGRRRQQRQQGEAQHDQRHLQVQPGDEAEDQERREGGDQKLRNILAEIGFQLLDTVDHGQRHIAGALLADIGRAKCGDLVVDRAAQPALYPGGGLVRHHDPPLLEETAQDHGASYQRRRQQQFLQRRPLEHPGDQPAQQCQPRDAQGHGGKTDGHGTGDAPAHTLGEGPEPHFEMHVDPRCRCHCVASAYRKRDGRTARMTGRGRYAAVTPVVAPGKDQWISGITRLASHSEKAPPALYRA